MNKIILMLSVLVLFGCASVEKSIDSFTGQPQIQTTNLYIITSEGLYSLKPLRVDLVKKKMKGDKVKYHFDVQHNNYQLLTKNSKMDFKVGDDVYTFKIDSNSLVNDGRSDFAKFSIKDESVLKKIFNSKIGITFRLTGVKDKVTKISRDDIKMYRQVINSKL